MNKLFGLRIFSKFNKESALSVFFPKVISKNTIFLYILLHVIIVHDMYYGKKKEKKCIMEKLDCSCFVETIVDAKIFLCSETFLNKHMACGISVNNTINYNPQIFSVIFSFISI